MTNNEFNEILDGTVAIINRVLRSKADEYARGDRLHNFKIASQLANTSPEMALRGMLAKHIVSVWDLISDVEVGNFASIPMWDEKIIDSINYLILLRAMVNERESQRVAKEASPSRHIKDVCHSGHIKE